MVTIEENETLTRVGPGTPMGEYFRRFWLPVLLDTELPRPDCDPVRTRVLGEDLVAFRDTSGRVGIVDAFCPHRRAPMYFGRNEEGGLRCVYHGQKFDCDGNCVDYPSAPEGSKLKERASIKAYPTYEIGGLVWIYMGPPELMPERPPDLLFTRMAKDELFFTKYLIESNWLQNLEGDSDLVHPYFTHSSTLEQYEGLQRTDGVETERYAHFDTIDTDYGMVSAARWRKSNGDYYWRVNQHIFPCGLLLPVANGHHGDTSFWIPIDDHHCWRIFAFGVANLPLVRDESGNLVRLEGFVPLEHGTHVFSNGMVIDTPLGVYRKSNNYGLDRERQRTQNYTGIQHYPTEDQALIEGMGQIVDRTKEHLDATDKGILKLRHRLLAALKDLGNGIEPRQPDVHGIVPVDIDSPIEDLAELLKATQAGHELVV